MLRSAVQRLAGWRGPDVGLESLDFTLRAMEDRGVFDGVAFWFFVCEFVLFGEGLRIPVYEHSYNCIFLHIIFLFFPHCQTNTF